MRVSSLLGSDVVDERLRDCGVVLDVALVQDGRMLGTFGAALRTDGLILGRSGLGARLGYDRERVTSPAVIRTLLRHIHGAIQYVPWPDIRSIEPDRIRVQRTVRGWGPTSGSATGAVIHAGFELLDRQLLDSDQRMAGKVDDLELTWPAEGGPPYVSAILAGPGALALRLGGRIGGWIESVHERLHPEEQPGPAEIPFGVVKRLGNHLDLAVVKDELNVDRFERWVRDNLIGRIPGSGK
jgi:sporulation protein YlmC with PRC-barrel domain